MNINTISMKQLREDFSSVKEKLEKGEELVLIYRSQPLAQISPFSKASTKNKTKKQKKSKTEKKVALIKKLSGGFKLGDWTPEELNRIYDKQYEEMLP